MPTTLKHVAKRVGLSVTTVSRALSGYPDVSQATRSRVSRAAAEMDYHPNLIARQLQKRRTDTLGLIIPTHGPRFSDPFFTELLAGIGNEAARQGFDLLVSTQPPGPQELDAYRRFILGRRVDGLLVVRTRTRDERIQLLTEYQFPFVAYGRTDPLGRWPYVDVDGELGMRLLARHLLSLGHRRFGYITAPLELTFAIQRLKGFQSELEAVSIGSEGLIIASGELTQRSGYEAGGELLSHPQPPTALVACNDLMALGAMSAAHARGLHVGRDVAVAGFDDIPPAAHAHPPLTTLRQPIYEIAQRIAAMLIGLIRGEPLIPAQVMLQPEIIIRESTVAQPLAMATP